ALGPHRAHGPAAERATFGPARDRELVVTGTDAVLVALRHCRAGTALLRPRGTAVGADRGGHCRRGVGGRPRLHEPPTTLRPSRLAAGLFLIAAAACSKQPQAPAPTA